MPRSFQIVGDVALVKLPQMGADDKQALAREFVRRFPRIKTVCEMHGITGELRKPVVSIILGNTTETVHKEHGVLFALDVALVMLSKGNVYERKRLVSHIRDGERVLDMFAGIGYFSIPIAKYTNAAVVAVEKNPVAFEYLLRNIELNKIKTVTAVHADCRDALFIEKLADTFDRILMGYLPGTEAYLPYAVAAVKDGGTVHFHNTYHKKDLWATAEDEVRRQCGRAATITNKKKVKSFAPNVYHVVLDIVIEKT